MDWQTRRENERRITAHWLIRVKGEELKKTIKYVRDLCPLTCSLQEEKSQLHICKAPTLNTEARVRERTIPTERPPLVSEVSANFFGYRVLRG
jgi:hypothetical protein